MSPVENDKSLMKEIDQILENGYEAKLATKRYLDGDQTKEILEKYLSYSKNQLEKAIKLRDGDVYEKISKNISIYEKTLLQMSHENDNHEAYLLSDFPNPLDIKIKKEEIDIVDETQMRERFNLYRNAAIYFQQDKNALKAKDYLDRAKIIKDLIFESRRGKQIRTSDLPPKIKDYSKLAVGSLERKNTKIQKENQILERALSTAAVEMEAETKAANRKPVAVNKREIRKKLEKENFETNQRKVNPEEPREQKLKGDKNNKSEETKNLELTNTPSNKQQELKKDKVEIKKHMRQLIIQIIDRFTDGDKVKEINSRIATYTKKAKELKNNGQLELAKICLNEVVQMEELLKSDLSKLSSDCLPPPNPLELEVLKQNYNQRKFQFVLQKLKKQIDLMEKKQKIFLILKVPQTAKVYEKYLNESKSFLDQVLKAQKSKKECPPFWIEKITLFEELRLIEIPFNRIEMQINNIQIEKKKFIKKSPDPTLFVMYSLKIPNEAEQKGTTKNLIRIDSRGLFEVSEKKLFEIQRNNEIAKKIRNSYVEIKLMQSKTLRKTMVGHVEIPITKLCRNNELVGNFKLLDSKSRNFAEVEVIFRVNVPFSKIQIEEVNYNYIKTSAVRENSLAQNKGETKKPSVPKKIEPSRSWRSLSRKNVAIDRQKSFKDKNVISVPIVEAKTPSLPDGLTEDMVENPLDLSYYVANDVLTHIKLSNVNKITSMVMEGKIPPVTLSEDVNEASSLLKMLEEKVQSEEITLESYLASVKDSIRKLKLLLEYFEKAGKKAKGPSTEVLSEVKARMEIMEKEVTEAAEI